MGRKAEGLVYKGSQLLENGIIINSLFFKWRIGYLFSKKTLTKHKGGDKLIAVLNSKGKAY